MQRKKSTKDTRNAAYKRLKQQFDLYVEFNTVRWNEVREAQKAAAVYQREYERRTVELNAVIQENEALKLEVEHLRVLTANCECEEY